LGLAGAPRPGACACPPMVLPPVQRQPDPRPRRRPDAAPALPGTVSHFRRYLTPGVAVLRAIPDPFRGGAWTSCRISGTWTGRDARSRGGGSLWRGRLASGEDGSKLGERLRRSDGTLTVRKGVSGVVWVAGAESSKPRRSASCEAVLIRVAGAEGDRSPGASREGLASHPGSGRAPVGRPCRRVG
jgi:hypothetical protein